MRTIEPPHPLEYVDSRIEHWTYCVENFHTKENNSNIKNLKTLKAMQSYWIGYKEKHYGICKNGETHNSNR